MIIDKKNKEQEFTLGFNRIRTISFAFKEPEHKIEKKTPIQFHYEWQFMVNPESDEIASRLRTTAKEKEDSELGSMEIEFLFHVKDLEKLRSPDQKIELPEELIRIIANLTISTARGIFFEKGRGTVLEKIIIPPVDLSDLLSRIKKQQ